MSSSYCKQLCNRAGSYLAKKNNWDFYPLWSTAQVSKTNLMDAAMNGAWLSSCGHSPVFRAVAKYCMAAERTLHGGCVLPVDCCMMSEDLLKSLVKTCTVRRQSCITEVLETGLSSDLIYNQHRTRWWGQIDGWRWREDDWPKFLLQLEKPLDQKFQDCEINAR